VQWFDTLPRNEESHSGAQARSRHDREEVVAAIGKPDHKVREPTPTQRHRGLIYGQPPSRTVFVRFTGDRVTGIKQFRNSIRFATSWW